MIPVASQWHLTTPVFEFIIEWWERLFLVCLLIHLFKPGGHFFWRLGDRKMPLPLSKKAECKCVPVLPSSLLNAVAGQTWLFGQSDLDLSWVGIFGAIFSHVSVSSHCLLYLTERSFQNAFLIILSHLYYEKVDFCFYTQNLHNFTAFSTLSSYSIQYACTVNFPCMVVCRLMFIPKSARSPVILFESSQTT